MASVCLNTLLIVFCNSWFNICFPRSLSAGNLSLFYSIYMWWRSHSVHIYWMNVWRATSILWHLPIDLTHGPSRVSFLPSPTMKLPLPLTWYPNCVSWDKWFLNKLIPHFKHGKSRSRQPKFELDVHRGQSDDSKMVCVTYILFQWQHVQLKCAGCCFLSQHQA